MGLTGIAVLRTEWAAGSRARWPWLGRDSVARFLKQNYKRQIRRSLKLTNQNMSVRIKVINTQYVKVVNWRWNFRCLNGETKDKISGADSMGHGGTSPHFYKCLGTGGTVSRRTANKKLIKLYWPSWRRSPKLLIYIHLVLYKNTISTINTALTTLTKQMCSDISML